jgi:hypothetical protein
MTLPVHDYLMPHDGRYEDGDVRGCPPNCPVRKASERDLLVTGTRPRPAWPSVPGSLILARAVDDSTPSPYFLLAPLADEPDAEPMWVHPERPDEPYRQKDLTLLGILWEQR